MGDTDLVFAFFRSGRSHESTSLPHTRTVDAVGDIVHKTDGDEVYDGVEHAYGAGIGQLHALFRREAYLVYVGGDHLAGV